MPAAAANPMKSLTVSDAATGAPAAPGGELFAALLSGSEAGGEAVAVEIGEAGEEAPEANAGETQPNLDILAPLLAQQQMVPTVTVPKVGAEAVTPETNVATDAVKASTTSPLVPSEVEGSLAPAVGPGAIQPTAVAPMTLEQPITGASRLRSGQAEVSEAPEASEADGETVTVQASIADLLKTPAKAGAPASQPAATPTLASPSQAATGDQQPGGGQPQPETPVPAGDVQAQQPSTSFTATDLRSLMASLTGTAAAAAAGPAQAGAAQQLGEALAAQVLDLAGGGEWLDQLSQEIGRAADGSGPLRFRLTPESLGELKVEISQSDRGAIVRMTVTTEAAQAALADAQPRLAAEARAQGVRIAEAQVDLAGGQAQQHQQGRESARQQAANADQPLRAFRATASASTHTQAEPRSGRSAERYA